MLDELFEALLDVLFVSGVFSSRLSFVAASRALLAANLSLIESFLISFVSLAGDCTATFCSVGFEVGWTAAGIARRQSGR